MTATTQTSNPPDHGSDRRPAPGPARANAKAMAGSFIASRAPHLRVEELLNLRALSAVARADLRCSDPFTRFIPATELTGEEAAIVAEAGWSDVPMAATRFDTLRVDFDELAEQVRDAWVHTLYLLTVAGYPTHEYWSWGQTDLEIIAALPDMLDRSRRPLTPRQRRWFLAG